MQSQEVTCGGRYLSCDDPLTVFAAGQAKEIAVEVLWRSGRSSHFEKLPPGCVHEITEPDSVLTFTERGSLERAVAPDTNSTPQFEDVSGHFNAMHQQNEFDDYQRQPLLPRKLSQDGPGVSWLDLNADGHDDLVLAAGHGKRMQMWLLDGTGKCSEAHLPLVSIPSRGDQTTILGWSTAPGESLLLVGVSGYQLAAAPAASVAVYSVSARGIKAVAGLQASANVGPLAVADPEGDGNLALFVGGQSEPGRYPVAVRSVIFRQAGGRFAEDAENTRRLAQVGLVNGAVWGDLDGDGDSDLVLACEWGPIRVFRNSKGGLTEATAELGLADLRGWWNGVSVGDFNGDGRMDIVASNWGRNTKYQEFLQDELRVYHGDLDSNGTWEVIEAYWDRGLEKEVPWRDFRLMSRAVPSILERFSTYSGYASASVREIFGAALRQAEALRANTLNSMLLLNTGRGFEFRPLPLPAQLTPAFASVVADFDGDGNEDIFLSQNSFAADPETGRYDAGASLLLRGDGAGNFVAVPAAVSGLNIYGEQRGAAVGDLDDDGRPDLVVTQHSSNLKVFRNREARPGLRVRLHGPQGNFNGIGAQLKLKFGEHYGAVRELHGGSGYWSQDSSTVILGKPTEPSHLWVRWPGGRVVETALPAGAREVSIDPQGTIRSWK
jgi:hypothetical protein